MVDVFEHLGIGHFFHDVDGTMAIDKEDPSRPLSTELWQGFTRGTAGQTALDDHDVGSKGAAITDQLGGQGRGSDDCDPADGC